MFEEPFSGEDLYTDGGMDVTQKYCDECDEFTGHEVSIEILKENEEAENPQYSREPYRVTECPECGYTESTRMNDA